MTIQKTLVNGAIKVNFLFNKEEQAWDDLYLTGSNAIYHRNNINYLNQ